jgi:chromosomal replication initiator protein
MLTPHQERQAHELHELIREIAAKHNISTEQLIGHNRRAGVVWARFELMHRARHDLGMSYKLIGRVLGGRDHTGIMHGVKRYEDWRAYGNLANRLARDTTGA